MGTPAGVIGAQYCVPSTCQYTLSKAEKRSKNWSVVDAANGAVICRLMRFKTNSNGWFPKYETQLVDAQGNIVARIQDKKPGRWKVLGGSADSNVLCSVKICLKGVLLHWKTAIKVFLASNSSEKQPDYTVDYTGLYSLTTQDYTILHGTQPMSKVETSDKLFGRPKYSLTVNTGVDCAFVFLLAMIMEWSRDNGRDGGGIGGGSGTLGGGCGGGTGGGGGIS